MTADDPDLDLDPAIDPAIDPVIERRLVAARPVGDAITRAVWRARVTGALFGAAPSVTIGRYQLQRPLGRGGGGSVYVARDPELHREVALKLIRCGSTRHRERALAEGRALARLSHPNVVPVHDVGETTDHVYLVMELLRGGSLRDYAGVVRRPRALLDAYRQAAAGLAAAHAVGLVHRDFKPDNAVLGDDGRLRVVDFGLASDTEAAAAPVGTPRYMAPEQHDPTAALGPAVDQFALGVALREAFADRGLPAWLGRVLTRATAARPADRYPSMAALAAALGNDPRTRWRRRALVAAPIVLAVIGYGLGRTGSAPAAASCSGGPAALADAWSPARTAAVMAHLAQLDTPFARATAPFVRGRLDALGAGWLTTHRATCQAHRRGELSVELHDRATVCLARVRVGLGQATELLANAAPTQLDAALTALAVVGKAERCGDPIALAAEARPATTAAGRLLDQALEEAAVNARAATPQAVPRATQVVAQARAAGDQATLARALVVLGHAHMATMFDTGGFARAVAPLHEAMLLAVETGQDDIAVEAYARHAYVLAETREAKTPLRALDGLELARGLGLRAGARGAFGRALLSNNVGSIAALAGDFARARVELRRALREGEQVDGAGAVELVTTVANLAMMSDDRDERARMFQAALDRVTAAVGPDSAQALSRRLQLVTDRDDPQRITDDLAPLCARIVQLHPTLDGLAQTCGFELAWQAIANDQPAAALAAARAVPAPPAEASLPARLFAAHARIAAGDDLAALQAELSTLVEEQRRRLDQRGWYQALFTADAELALAAAAHADGAHARARDAATRAIGHLDHVVAATGVTSGMVARRLAWARRLRGGDQPGGVRRQ